jgi:hypothetical protein
MSEDVSIFEIEIFNRNFSAISVNFRMRTKNNHQDVPIENAYLEYHVSVRMYNIIISDETLIRG